MTIFILTVVLTLVLAAVASAHRPGEHPAGTLDAPLLHWLGSTRQATNAELRSKCRPRPVRGTRPARLVPEFLRRYTIIVELGRLSQAREVPSNCERARAESWYQTSGAACVVSKEGAWTSNTGNGYYGAFQADISFQRSYGPEFYRAWGTANYWPSWAQKIMGYRGWLNRGWYPWPNTARACGLI